MKLPRFIYKTLIESFDKCGRYGYLKYFFMGHGVESDRQSPERAVGTSCHRGVEVLFLEHKHGNGYIDAAVAAAHAKFDFETEGMFVGMATDDATHLIREFKSVIEGALRLWAVVRLPKLLAEYEVIDAEVKMYTPISPELTLMAKPDGILRSRFDGRLYDFSLKTEKSHGRIKHPTAMIDIGGLTEVITVATTAGDGKISNVGGVLMEYIVVGEVSRKEPIIWHPAHRGWYRLVDPNDLNSAIEYAWKWECANPNYDPMGPVSSQKNPQNVSLKKKDGWERFEARDYPGGIAAWVRDLADRKFYPYHIDPAAELLHAPAMYKRTAGQVESFITQVTAEHHEINRQLELVEAGALPLDRAVAFRQRFGNCLRYGEDYRCEMWNICHEGLGTDPLSNGYRQRKSSAERAEQEKAFLLR